MNTLVNWAAIVTLLIGLMPAAIRSDSYFIRLSESGMERRKELLETDNQRTILAKKGFSGTRFSDICAISKSRGVLDRWIILEADPRDEKAAREYLESAKLIEYFEPAGHFYIDPLTNDSLVTGQWYLDRIDVRTAWNISRGLPDVIVGVIDTGVDYLHPDLVNQLWVNPAEDRNGNGRLDEEDLNGIDDDNNGFIDDVIGWDFTDAPRFADGGDFEEPDNDPMDEYPSGHGTQIAGIIAAESNNDKGISGIAPGVRIMNLRAGTASGYLEEDDVARAILYAIENGARIINMSFGDVALSSFLKDVIGYAHQLGVVMVASSGNEGGDRMHYPSGLPGTISVGATTENDQRATFSDFGTTLDLVAPGERMLSTAVGGGYNTVSGTSFSAPVVSAVAALILSEKPDLEPEQVRNILKTSSDDILIPGWDYWSGAGRVSAGAALKTVNGGMLELTRPKPNSSTALDSLWLTGSIVHPDLEQATVSFGMGENPEEWTEINTFKGRQVLDDTLGLLVLKELQDTTITLRLRMFLINQGMDEWRTSLQVDRTAPVIKDIAIQPLLDSYKSSVLISFTTDDVSTAGIRFRKTGERLFSYRCESEYETLTHRIKIDQDHYEGNFEFYIEVMNRSGLVTTDSRHGDYYRFDLEERFIWRDFIRLPWTLPPGYMLPEFTDLDHDNRMEVIMSRYDSHNAFGPIEIYEFENDQFVLRMKTGFRAIPRAAGDVDGDGLSDLLLGYGQNAYLLEAVDAYTFPSELVWADTTQFWAAGYADLDADGRQELIGWVDTEYLILENTGDNRFQEIGRLENTSAGENRFGVPHIATGDINGDEKTELLFGDLDGDLLLYSSIADNSFTLLAQGRTTESDATEMMVMNDEGICFIASHTPDDRNYEHEFDARYWVVEKLFYDSGQSVLAPEESFGIYGYQSTRDFDSGMHLGTINGKRVLFTSFYPNLYLFMEGEKGWTPVWHYQGARSNTVLTGDLDGDGNDEFYFNDGSSIIGYGTAATNRPSAPQYIEATPLDSVRSRIRWKGTAPAYALYRGIEKSLMQRITVCDREVFTDSLLTPETMYYYTVTALEAGFEYDESMPGRIDSVLTSYPPKLIRLHSVNAHQLILEFNEPVHIQDPGIELMVAKQIASSVSPMPEPRKLLVSFAADFTPDVSDTLMAKGITDEFGVPLDAHYDRIAFRYGKEERKPYLESYHIPDRFHILLTFSVPMDTFSLLTREHYILEPSGQVQEINITDERNTSVELVIDRSSYVGGFGKAAYLIMKGLKSAEGMALTQTGKIHLLARSGNLDQMVIYPQPLKPQHDMLTFAAVPEDVEIHIYTINGRLIKTLRECTFFGGVCWDLVSDRGEQIPSGIYLYEIRHKDEKRLGKLVILR